MHRRTSITLVVLVLLANVGGDAAVQELRVTERTDLKWSATGRTLGWLASGTALERLGGRGGWLRVRVRGWVRERGLAPAGDGARIVDAEERLRAGPAGAVRGGLVRDVEVERVGGEGAWVEVAVIGWVAADAVEEVAAAAAEPVARERPAAEPASRMGRLAGRARLQRTPEGGDVAAIAAGAPVRVLETRGSWTRVAVEGWVPSAAVEDGAGGDPGPDVVASAPAGTFVGRTVTWTLEFVALQTADAWRPDLAEGETYALARAPSAAGLVVYVVLPEPLRESARALDPFERFRVEGRVRSGRSELTGSPVVDATRLLP